MQKLKDPSFVDRSFFDWCHPCADGANLKRGAVKGTTLADMTQKSNEGYCPKNPTTLAGAVRKLNEGYVPESTRRHCDIVGDRHHYRDVANMITAVREGSPSPSGARLFPT